MPPPPPPPPVMTSSILMEQRKRKKRFIVVSQPSSNIFNPNIPRPPTLHRVNDFQIIPLIHYGLDRTGTIFAMMDKDNILTHSPTLISFGGNSFEFGYQKSLVMLDLDPATKYSKDGGLDPGFEYEWKPIKTLNNEIFDTERISGSVYFPLIYSKLYQCIYVLGSCWAAKLSLKTLKWEKTYLKYDGNVNYFHFGYGSYPRFALPYGNDQFLMCTIKPPSSTTSSKSSEEFSIYNFSDLENCFNLEQVSNNEPPQLSNSDNSDDQLLPAVVKHYHEFNGVEQLLKLTPYRDVQSRMTVPLHPNNKVVFFGGNYPDYVHVMDFNQRKMIKQTWVVDNSDNCCLTEIPPLSSDDFTGTVLIAGTEYYYLYNVVSGKSKILNVYAEPVGIEKKFQRLFQPFMASFKTRKNENQVVHLINNDIMFILKLDYKNPEIVFNGRLNQSVHFCDIEFNFI